MVRAQLHHRDTILIGFHGDNSAPAARLQPQHPAPSHLHSLDTTLAASISHLNKIITDLSITPSTDIILMADHNHRIHPSLDYHSAAGKADTPLPAARAAFTLLLTKLQLVDSYRTLHPHTREYTRADIQHGATISRSRIDGIFINAHLVTGKERALTSATHIPPTDKSL